MASFIFFPQIYVMLGNAHFGDGEEVESSEGSNTARYVIIPIQCHSELSSPMGFEKVTDDDNVMVRLFFTFH